MLVHQVSNAHRLEHQVPVALIREVDEGNIARLALVVDQADGAAVKRLVGNLTVSEALALVELHRIVGVLALAREDEVLGANLGAVIVLAQRLRLSLKAGSMLILGGEVSNQVAQESARMLPLVFLAQVTKNLLHIAIQIDRPLKGHQIGSAIGVDVRNTSSHTHDVLLEKRFGSRRFLLPY